MSAPTQRVEVAIIGAGFAGLAMAIELKKAGFDGWKIFEGAAELGGTWRENTYPGCACDVPSALYSLSFEPNPRWSRTYSPSHEILEYMKGVAERNDLYRDIQFSTWIHEADWDDEARKWTLRASDGEVIEASIVVFGVGPLSRPRVPHFDGREDFQGETWHSAEWNHDVDLHGKRVAAIGTGASAVQYVPEIAKEATTLDVYQRTASWCLPKLDRPTTRFRQGLFEKFPAARWAHRAGVYWIMEAWGSGFALDPRLMKLSERAAKRFIRESFPDDPAMQEKLTPPFSMGCKRVLFTNDYYPALARKNVELLTSGIDRFTRRGILDRDGVEREYDVVIFGTGFHATDLMDVFAVKGRDGVDLRDAWRDGMEAYLGISVAGFPNFFMLLGPNTGLGHSSVLFMIEAQARFIRGAIEKMRKTRSRAIEVRPQVQRDYNQNIQERLKRSIWQSGCQSWYLQEDGKNTTLWPGYTWEYWLRTRELDDDAFRLTW